MAKMAQGSTSSKLPLSGPSYSMTFSFEENFDGPKSTEWFFEYAHVPYILGIGVYLSVIYFGQKIMANKEPIKARSFLILWNFALAAFSIIGFIRVSPEFFHTVNKYGFKHSICNNSYLHVKPAVFWTWLFVLSKIPELVDTVFLVLRKQNLKFLHVYHHASVLIFSWFVYANKLGVARWFCTMNFAVHSVMYSYYALKALPNLIWIPKWVSMLITASQTVQMLVGTCVTVSAAYLKVSGQECAINPTMTMAGLGIYVSYMLLFSHFFYTSYLMPTSSKARDEKKKA